MESSYWWIIFFIAGMGGAFSLLFKKDTQLGGIVGFIAVFIFIALCIIAPDNTSVWYDTNTQTFMEYRLSETTSGMQQYLLIFISGICALFLGMNSIMLLVYKPMMQGIGGNEQTTNPKPLRIPKGFGR